MQNPSKDPSKNPVPKKNILRFVLALLFIPTVIYIWILFQVVQHAETSSAKVSDTILVLGSRSYVNGRYNPCLLARVTQGVRLLQSKMAPQMIVSGGNDVEDGINEAETMRKMALELGVLPEQIIMENKSSSTRENMVFSLEVMKKRGFKTAIITSDPFHLWRAGLLAQKLELNHTLSPALDSLCWTRGEYRTKFVLREGFAVIDNFFKGFL
jgi:uncharacterized SAM-binding protein YcdF (DUF218 family)